MFTTSRGRAALGGLVVILALAVAGPVLRGGPAYTAIAVLPFENLSGDPTQEYFADGVHDALITALGQGAAFDRVIARGAVMRFKRTDVPPVTVAQTLKVDALVTGSMLRSGNRVRLTLRLADPQAGTPLWSQAYEREVGDLPVLAHDIVAAIARAANVGLSQQETARRARARRIDPEAYDACLKGQLEWYLQTRQSLEEALQHFSFALQREPRFAPAHIGVSGVWASRKWQNYARPDEATPLETAGVLKALEFDDTSADAHFRLAGVKTWAEWDWAGAEREFRRAIALNPSQIGSRIDFSHLLSIMKREKEALQQADRAMALDPVDPWVKAFYAMDLLYVHRYDDAIALLRETLRTSPNDAQVLSTLRTAYHLKGMHAEALEIWKASYATRGDQAGVDALAAGFKDGGYLGALQRLAELLVARSRTTYVTPWQIATLYTRAGKRDEALEWLTKACDIRDPNMPYIGADPIFDYLRSDPRFKALVRRMGLPG
jgi:TolB-like protein